MIERVHFKNFKALRDVEVELTPLTVIVGPNGSGKTSMLEGISAISQFAYTRIDYMIDAGRTRTANQMEPMELGAAVRWDGETGELVLSVEFVADEEPALIKAVPRLSARWGELKLETSKSEQDLSPRSSWSPFYKAFGRVVILRLSPRHLAYASYVEERIPKIQSTGEGLASVLNDLASSVPDAMAAIEEALRAIVPSVRRVRTERASVVRTETEYIKVDGAAIPRTQQRTYWGHRVLIDTTSGTGIPIQDVSEGTVLTLGLLTVLLGHNPPRILLLDDIDRALHPKAQEDLVTQLRKILAARPDLQIVATSHSPYLLDALRFEEVRLTTLRDDGSVACAPLTAHPEYERWKDQVRPGELWTSSAESWVADRPSPGS